MLWSKHAYAFSRIQYITYIQEAHANAMPGKHLLKGHGGATLFHPNQLGQQDKPEINQAPTESV